LDYSKIDITSLLSFLTAMYNEGCSYSYINTARSALSVIFGITEEAKLGDHPLVCRFMAGIKNLRKPLPKYPVLWDASVLLQFLCQWQVADDDLKGVTLKLVTIIACLSVQRMNTLSKIAVSPVQFQPSGGSGPTIFSYNIACGWGIGPAEDSKFIKDILVLNS